MELKNIIVGVDFSKGSDLATEVAIGVARRNGARVHLIHAGPIPAPKDAIPPDSYLELVRSYHADELRRARENLAGLYERLSKQGVDLDHAVIDEPPETALPRLAAEQKASLLVVGSYGRTGAERFFLGSVAERVSRLATCPVLVVRHSMPARGAENVVVGVDFNELGKKALALAPVLAAGDAKLDLVHAWTPPLGGVHYSSAGGSWIPVAGSEEIRTTMRKQVEKRGAEWLAAVKTEFPKARFVDREGPASAVILAHAEENRADLVVIGSHGRTGLKRLLIGSSAERIIRHAPCSVLVVH
jgi:nucleotide-binding universal stress UspA family protein